jgi:CubicO group peptidase (beta-lactamase class C family)
MVAFPCHVNDVTMRTLLTLRVEGNELYSKLSGYDSVSADASPLREDAVLKVASCTKLITSIALLQCVEKGLLSLDEPLDKILPELADKEILTGESEMGFTFKPSKNKITARQLLTHTSGLGYSFISPLLMKWLDSPAQAFRKDSQIITEKYNYPLLYEPGTGWTYSSSLDWAGVVVRRLHGGISLEDYMIEHIWKPVGLASPFPTFAISQHPEYKARLMQAAERTPDGELKPQSFWFGDNSVDQEGGAGLALTVKDYLAVLTDLISDSPKLLKPETISMMLTPQIATDSPALPMLVKDRQVWEMVAGPISEDAVNHGRLL